MRWLILVLLGAGLILVRMSLFAVDRTEFAYVTQFGRPVATYDGARQDQAGLHIKWPWPIQSVQRLDRRLQSFDLPGAELLTRDPQRNTIDKTLTLDAYVCWRIGDDPGNVERFIVSVATPEGARRLLTQRISSELGAAIGQMELDDLISTEPGKVDRAREQLRQRLLNGAGKAGEAIGSLRQTALEEYGIDVLDVRLRRTNHPATVREAIFARIVSERNKKADEYLSEGKKRAADIDSDSKRKVAEMRADADAAALRLRGQTDADVDRIRNDTARLDPQFYSFLRKLDDYQRILGDNKTLLLLSTHRELFDSLFNPPTQNSNAKSQMPNPKQ